jgi:hypothetical protein
MDSVNQNNNSDFVKPNILFFFSILYSELSLSALATRTGTSSSLILYKSTALLIQEEIKRRLNSDNACYHSVQNFLSSRLLSRNIKIRMYKTIILPVVLYGHETWSLTLREEHRLKVFENRVMRRIFGPKR